MSDGMPPGYDNWRTTPPDEDESRPTWRSPRDWLTDKLAEALRGAEKHTDAPRFARSLHSYAMDLLEIATDEQVETFFEDEMREDGYYRRERDPDDEGPWADREER